MEYNILGNTGLKVSKICFGALTIGPLQSNLSLEAGAEVIKYALECGINFIDTAELYQTYPYIKEGLRRINGENTIIATKSYAYSAPLMADSLDKARRELDRDIIDIFLLHEQESALTIKGHWEAVEYLVNAKAQGKVKAIGLSTHTIAGVKGALAFPEIEVIHPIVNYQGLGINDGGIDEMLKLLRQAKEAGKGIYGMKPIGGGNLLNNINKALEWAFKRPELDAVAIGMQSREEININLALLQGQEPHPVDLKNIKAKKRYLQVEDYCQGCGQCLHRCSHKALILHNKKAQVNMEKCVLCGYCGAVCPNFAIKII